MESDEELATEGKRETGRQVEGKMSLAFVENFQTSV